MVADIEEVHKIEFNCGNQQMPKLSLSQLADLVEEKREQAPEPNV